MGNIAEELNWLQTKDESDPHIANLRRCLTSYNDAHWGESKRENLGLFLEDSKGGLSAGLWGWSHFGWFYIAMIWVDESLKRQGIGKKLMEKCEQVASRRGCKHIYLDTFSPEAVKFYLTFGYKVFSTLEDFPPGHKRTFLKKDISTKED